MTFDFGRICNWDCAINYVSRTKGLKSNNNADKLKNRVAFTAINYMYVDANKILKSVNPTFHIKTGNDSGN